MDYPTISKLADAGYIFAPTSMGMTRSDRDGWPDLATNDKQALKQWVGEGCNLVSVARHGAGYMLDVDDVPAVKAMGFDLAWLDGYYVVDTPSGGLHAYGLHDAETEALGNLAVVRAEKGNSQSRKILELKLHNQSVAAPTAIRLHQPGKKDGEYLPRGEFHGARKGLPAPMLAWIKEHAGEPKAAARGGNTRFELHPDFELEELLENEGCTEKQSGWVDGSFHVEVESCPHCCKEARESTLAAAVTKLIFSGTGYGFICHACGVDSREEHERLMEEDDPRYEPWQGFIYRHDDDELLFADGAKAGLEVATLTPDGEAREGEGAAPGEGSPVDPAGICGEAHGEAASPDTSEFLYEPTDTGNGERLVRKFGHLVRWIPEISAWMVWGERGWREDASGTLMRTSKRVVEEILAEARIAWNDAIPEADPDSVNDAKATLREARQHQVDRKEIIQAKVALAQANAEVDKDAEKEARALLKHAKDSGKLERRKAMIASAGFEKGILSNLHEWDADGWLFNCENGVIDLRAQAFRERTQADLCLKQSPVIYDPKAECPLWESAMAKWMCGDRELVEYLQAALGVTLTSDTSLQCLFFCQGGGENGKDAFLTTIGHVMGSYWKNVGIMTLMETRYGHSEHRNDLAALAGAARMVTATESSDGHSLDEGVVKALTGCTPITCRQIHGRPFTFVPQFKLWLSSNYEPVIKGNDWGIWRRVKKIPWNHDFSLHPEEKDPDFPAKLRTEAPGILNWMLAGTRRYLELGKRLPPCKAVDEATARYRKDMDIIGRFVEERLAFKPTAAALAGEIYKAYASWCKENGSYATNSRRFLAEFQKRHPGLEKRRTMTGYQFIGVGLPFEETLPEDWDDAVPGVDTRKATPGNVI